MVSRPSPLPDPEPRTSAESRREAAKQETRQALLQAALAEFSEKGLDTPSLDAICARAGFTRGAFYVHFRDRDDLVAAAMEHALGLFLDALLAGPGDAAELEEVVGRYVAIAARGLADEAGRGAPVPLPGEGVPFHQLMAACRRNDETRRRFISILTEARERLARAAVAGQRLGRVRADVDAGDAAQLLVLLAIGVRAAADLRLPVRVEGTRDALLRLLAAPGADGA